MQFVKNGPNVPEKLLQAHEEDRVVFFCGAGISFPAKLPGFGGLVWNLYDAVGVEPSVVQKQALKSKQFDTAVSLLEAVKPTIEWRRYVREEMAKLLVPDYSSPKATKTHKALLQLANTSDNKTRLITTNFDRIFKKVADDERLNIKDFKAPLLPVPKNRWDGLVYLHGFLPENANGYELDHLVISSGDFGLAYLTERWAARFVSELFRSYTVCFVGYSLNDPVLRYMMDALAADKLLGESTPEMFAFGNFKQGEYEKEEQQWLAKNVTPVLYRNHSNHYYLHETLSKWSDTYRDGLSGKEQIVVTTAFSNPSSSDLHYDYARKLAWALSDPTGIPAKRFSKLNPAPPLAWLNVLADIELKKEDLSRYGIIDNNLAEDIKFNLFNRPVRTSLSPNMALARNMFAETRWDDVMSNLGDWLVRHLGSPDLVLFILKQGGILNSTFQWKINSVIDEQKKKRSEGDSDYFTQLNISSPDAELSEDMLMVWSLILAGYCEQSNNSVDLYSWIDKYKFSGVNTALKKEIKTILSPKVNFKKPYKYQSKISNAELKNILDWDISLSTSFVHSSVERLKQLPQWKVDAEKLLPDFIALLKETMDLMADLGGVEERHDYSYIHQPSIKEHSQNKNFRDWTALIHLTRDSWISLTRKDLNAAVNVALGWWAVPYPVFKRLALFAALEIESIPTSSVIKWLEEDDSYWLWSVVSQREVLQLLGVLLKRINSTERQRLLHRITEGPQRKWFKSDLTEERFSQICEREIWLRLEKVKTARVELDDNTNHKYESITVKYPKWQLTDDRDEFPFWMGDGNEPRSMQASPTDLNGLMQWLKNKLNHDRWGDDDWPIRCKENYEISSKALIALGNEGIWITERWREALQVWTESETLSDRAWQELSEFILRAPNDKLIKISWNLCRWLKTQISAKKINDESYFHYFNKLIDLPYEMDLDDINDPLNAAINHPVGILTESLFAWWYNLKPNDNDELTSEFEKQLDNICDDSNVRLTYGKIIVTSNILSLFRVDPKWTIKTLLPWFNWENEDLASMVWRSYLWSPRLHKGLLLELKPDLLTTAKYYDKLGSYKDQYARFLTYIALQQYNEYKTNELSNSFNLLPTGALYHVASSLNDGLSSSGDKLSEYWEHRVKIFLLKLWPKQVDLDDNTVNELGLLCLSAKQYFNEAFKILKHSLRHTNDNEYLTRKLLEGNIIQENPTIILEFLDKLIGEPKYRLTSKLEECLNHVIHVSPNVVSEPAYKRLLTIVKRFG